VKSIHDEMGQAGSERILAGRAFAFDAGLCVAFGVGHRQPSLGAIVQ
jgi:hypothetical protein